MNEFTKSQTPNAVSTNAPSGILQRKCDCGAHTIAGDKCDDCENKQGVLQRKSSNISEQSEVPPVVHEVLNSSGQPLDNETRGFFESRFEHNFSRVPVSSVAPQLSQSSLKIGEASDVYEQEADHVADTVMQKEENTNERQNAKFDLSQVRVHTDAKAAASARAINAQAYTFGNNIVFGAGQFAPNTRGGRHLIAHELAHVAQQSGAARRKVIQRKKVPTNFGEFETTKFVENPGKGVEILLKFHPDTAKVDATKIALSQSVKAMNKAGTPVAVDPNAATRMVGSGKSGAGYRIDRISSRNNPLYGGRELTAAEDLKDTPISGNTTVPITDFGQHRTYQIGQPKDADKDKRAAVLYDRPEGGIHNLFETTALAIEGTDKDKYYGSVKWGFKMGGTAAAPTVTKWDITEVSKGTPSANFIQAAKLWNKAKTRGTLEVIADPEATVTKPDGTTEKLAKGKKLKQISPVMLPGDINGLEAEILKADGTGSGKRVFVKNSDLKDAGDGAETKDLPIPAAPAPKKRAAKPAKK